MRLQLIGFPPILKDNDLSYLEYLDGVIASIDEYANCEATNRVTGISFRIAPSTPIYTQKILKAIKDFHYLLSLRVEFSKSIRTSSTIEYQINFGDIK